MPRLGYCLTLLITLTSVGVGKTQSTNLVPNSGFEEHTRCDQLVDNRSLPLAFATSWLNPSQATPWLIHSCYSAQSIFYKAGITSGHQGQGCVYLSGSVDPDDPTNYERMSGQYALTALKAPLVAGQLYCFEAFLRVFLQEYLDPKINTNVQGFGVYFSEQPLSSTNAKPFKVRPQLINTTAYNTTWAPFRACFRATGGERYMTFGFFYKEIEQFKNCVALLDDVSLTPLDDQLLGRDTSLCVGSSLTLQVNLPCAKSYRWSDGSGESTLRVGSPGRYWVQAETDCGTVTDTIQVDERRNELDLGPDTTLCLGQQRKLLTPPAARSIRWDDESSGTERLVKKGGTHWVYTEQNGCPKRDEITLQEDTQPMLTLPTDTTRCNDGPALLLQAGPLTYRYRWSDGMTGANRSISKEGVYQVEVQNSCGAAQSTVRVQVTDCKCYFHWPTAFTPNGDGLNDLLTGYIDCGYRSIQNIDWRVYNRWGEIVYQARSLQPGWDGSINGVVAPSGVYTCKVLITTERQEMPQTNTLISSVLLLR